MFGDCGLSVYCRGTWAERGLVSGEVGGLKQFCTFMRSQVGHLSYHLKQVSSNLGPEDRDGCHLGSEPPPLCWAGASLTVILVSGVTFICSLVLSPEPACSSFPLGFGRQEGT